MKQEVKKLLILNLPYLLFVYLFDKIGAAIRLTPGADASEKLLQLGTGFAAAFSSIAPSLHPADLLIGIAGAVIIRLAVYMSRSSKSSGSMLRQQRRAAQLPQRKPPRIPARQRRKPPRKQGKRRRLWQGTRRALVSPLPRCSYSSW